MGPPGPVTGFLLPFTINGHQLQVLLRLELTGAPLNFLLVISTTCLTQKDYQSQIAYLFIGTCKSGYFSLNSVWTVTYDFENKVFNYKHVFKEGIPDYGFVKNEPI
jgi:hypothetical protein